MKSTVSAALLLALVAVAAAFPYQVVEVEPGVHYVRVARSPQFFSGSAANANAQSFGGGFGGFRGSGASANAASQSFGGGFGRPGGFSGSSANAGAQSFGFGR
jgi:hypothetical protein